jgi:DNA modification methylase
MTITNRWRNIGNSLRSGWLKPSEFLKDDGRIAVNIPYEINVQDRGGRVLFMSEFWSVMKKVGFKFYGLVDLDENAPHRSKTTAWGSWMSPSSPYIYNPKECVVLAYKKDRIKKVKGEPQWELGKLWMSNKKTEQRKKKTSISKKRIRKTS